jgi:hypothetical protein
MYYCRVDIRTMFHFYDNYSLLAACHAKERACASFFLVSATENGVTQIADSFSSQTLL